MGDGVSCSREKGVGDGVRLGRQREAWYSCMYNFFMVRTGVQKRYVQSFLRAEVSVEHGLDVIARQL